MRRAPRCHPSAHLLLPVFHPEAQALTPPSLSSFLCQTDRNITKLDFSFNVSFPSWPAALRGGCQGPGRGCPTPPDPDPSHPHFCQHPLPVLLCEGRLCQKTRLVGAGGGWGSHVQLRPRALPRARRVGGLALPSGTPCCSALPTLPVGSTPWFHTRPLPSFSLISSPPSPSQKRKGKQTVNGEC